MFAAKRIEPDVAETQAFRARAQGARGHLVEVPRGTSLGRAGGGGDPAPASQFTVAFPAFAAMREHYPKLAPADASPRAFFAWLSLNGIAIDGRADLREDYETICEMCGFEPVPPAVFAGLDLTNQPRFHSFPQFQRLLKPFP